jgi:DNA-binding CsgD family transcriptional regulator
MPIARFERSRSATAASPRVIWRGAALSTFPSLVPAVQRPIFSPSGRWRRTCARLVLSRRLSQQSSFAIHQAATPPGLEFCVLQLTEAEVLLAQALQAGVRLKDHARARGISINTIYAHLRSIKQKTGCHRMGELIRRLNDLQAAARSDRADDG